MRQKVYRQLHEGFKAESRKLAEGLLKKGPEELVSVFALENANRLVGVELISEANDRYYKQLAKTRKLKKALKHVVDSVVEYKENVCGLKCEDCKLAGLQICNFGKIYAEVKKAMEAAK